MSKSTSHSTALARAFRAIHAIASGSYDTNAKLAELEGWRKDTQGLMDILNDKTTTIRMEFWLWVYCPPSLAPSLASKSLIAAATALGLGLTITDIPTDGNHYRLRLEYEAYPDGTPAPLPTPTE